MSNKVAIGSKIYDISNFSDQEQDDLNRLAKSLNYRVNQVISAFGVYDQEMALVLAALSLLEENESLKIGAKQEGLFPKDELKKHYSKEEVDAILIQTISSLTAKLKQVLEKK
jgi:hypothetical protein